MEDGAGELQNNTVEMLIRAAESEEAEDKSINSSTLCPFAAAFTPDVEQDGVVDTEDKATNDTAGDAAAIEGCTKRLRQEVSTLTGMPFPTGHFRCLEQLVAAVRLMGRNVVIVVETDNQCSIAGFSSPIK